MTFYSLQLFLEQWDHLHICLKVLLVQAYLVRYFHMPFRMYILVRNECGLWTILTLRFFIMFSHLAMPMAFKNAGILVGTLGTLIVGFICTHCVHILVSNGLTNNNFTAHLV